VNGRRRVLVTGLLAMLCLAVPGVGPASPADRVLYISTAFGSPISTPGHTGFFDRIMRELCARIDYQVVIEVPQAERALMLANAGINDGDGPRIPNLDDIWNYSNLVRVKEKLLDIDFVAFSLDQKLSGPVLEDSADREIAIVTGWKILERRFAGSTRLTKVKDVEHLFLLLKYGRTDVVIIDRYSGLSAANRLGMTTINVSDQPLISTPMYLYLNSKHADLAERMSAVLQEMKRDGTYQRIHDATLSHVILESAR
jgi:polar amino acid transport system substrate-binding protein